MKYLTGFFLLLVVVLFTGACYVKLPLAKKEKVLLFAKTKAFYHESIPYGIEAIKKLGAEHNFEVVVTKDSSVFTGDTLKQYAAVIFLSTTGNIFGPEQEAAFTDYIHKGGGYVGIHAAADCEYNWKWYGELVGGYFKSHPKQQTAKLNVVNKDHPSTKGLPDVWERFDEWYNYKDLNPSVTKLITIDETSYTGGANGGNHPMAWYHNFEGGRAFYTGFGHTNESYSETHFLNHLLGGIEWAMGRKK